MVTVWHLIDRASPFFGRRTPVDRVSYRNQIIPLGECAMGGNHPSVVRTDRRSLLRQGRYVDVEQEMRATGR